MVKIDYLARGRNEWQGATFGEGLAQALESLGHQVSRRVAPVNSRTRFKSDADIIFLPKLHHVHRDIWRQNAVTIWHYRDYRPPKSDGHIVKMSRADIKIFQYETDEGFWAPPPVNCDFYNVNRNRSKNWLWTGQKAIIGQADLRNRDVACLPPDTTRCGWSGDRSFVRSKKYFRLIETHKYGLSVSHYNNIPKYTSKRLGDYLAGGITPAVRYFPGVEDMVPPDVFVYEDRDELRDFIEDPIQIDPEDLHDFAREVYDVKIFAKRIVKLADDWTKNA